MYLCPSYINVLIPIGVLLSGSLVPNFEMLMIEITASKISINHTTMFLIVFSFIITSPRKPTNLQLVGGIGVFYTFFFSYY